MSRGRGVSIIGHRTLLFAEEPLVGLRCVVLRSDSFAVLPRLYDNEYYRGLYNCLHLSPVFLMVGGL